MDIRHQKKITGPEQRAVHWGWNLAVAFGAIAALGAFSAAFIPAFAGVKSSDPFSSVGVIFWFGLLCYFFRKRYGQSGGRGWLVGGLAGLAVAFSASILYEYQAARKQNETDLVDIQSMIAELNAGLPQMVDEGLRLDSYEADGDVLIMHITTVGKLAKEIDVEQWMSESEARLAESGCNDPKYRQILQSGVIYEYRYRDESGAPVVSVQLNKSDCE